MKLNETHLKVQEKYGQAARNAGSGCCGGATEPAGAGRLGDALRPANRSAYRSRTVPETWVPTCTVVTASTVPLVDTTLTIDPRDTTSVVTSGTEAPRRALIAAAPIPTRMSASAAKKSLRFMTE